MNLKDLPRELLNWLELLKRKSFDIDPAAPRTAIRINQAGDMGLSIPAPQAKFHLPPGSTNKAPVMLEEGSILTRLRNGAIESDGLGIYWTGRLPSNPNTLVRYDLTKSINDLFIPLVIDESSDVPLISVTNEKTDNDTVVQSWVNKATLKGDHTPDAGGHYWRVLSLQGATLWFSTQNPTTVGDVLLPDASGKDMLWQEGVGWYYNVGGVWVKDGRVNYLEWGTQIDSSQTASVIGHLAQIQEAAAGRTTGFYAQKVYKSGYGTQNLNYLYQADMGDMGNCAGFNAFGSAGTGNSADGKHISAWERSTSKTAKVATFGNGAYNSLDATGGYAENVFIRADGTICFTNGSHTAQKYVGLKPPSTTIPSSIDFELPVADGAADDVMATDGSGKLAFEPAHLEIDYLGNLTGKRPKLNFYYGDGISISVIDNAVSDAVDVTINCDLPTSRCIQAKVLSDTSTLTTGDGKLVLCIPAILNGMNLVAAHAYCSTVSSAGTPTVQIRNVTDAVDMLSVAITIDANEYTSYTAATQPTIDTNHDDVATGDRIAVDIDVAGTGCKGIGVLLTFDNP